MYFKECAINNNVSLHQCILSGWYKDLIVELCETVPDVGPLLKDRLTEKITIWLKDHDTPICRCKRYNISFVFCLFQS